MRGFQVHRKAGWDTHGLPVEIEVEKQPGLQTQGRHRSLRRGRVQCQVPRIGLEVQGRMGADDGTDGLLGGSDPALRHVRERLHRIGLVGPQALLRRGAHLQRVQDPAVLPAVRDPPLLARSFPGLRRRQGPERLRAPPAEGVRRHIVPGLDDHPVDPDLERRAGGCPGRRLRQGPARGRVPDPCRSASLRPGRRLPEVVERYKGKDLAGKEYHRMFSYHPVERESLLRGRGGLRDDGGRYGYRPHRSGVRRGRLPAFAGERISRPSIRSTAAGSSVRTCRTSPGSSSRTPIADIIRVPEGARDPLKKETITHSYPHCWRCDTPLLYYARDSWYIKTTSYEAAHDRPEPADQLGSPGGRRGTVRQLARREQGLGAFARPVLGYAAAGLDLRGLRSTEMRGEYGGTAGRAERPRTARSAQAVRRRGDLHLFLRRHDAANPRADRRLVRFGRDALRPVALSLREPGEDRRR